MRTVRAVNADPNQRDEQKPPTSLGPVDLAKAVLSWIVVAIATVVVVWLLVFAVTRGDLLGLGIAVAVGVALVGVALLRRRAR